MAIVRVCRDPNRETFLEVLRRRLSPILAKIGKTLYRSQLASESLITLKTLLFIRLLKATRVQLKKVHRVADAKYNKSKIFEYFSKIIICCLEKEV